MAPRASEVAHTVTVLTAWLTCLPAADPDTSMSDNSKMLSSVYEHAVCVIAVGRAGIWARFDALSLPGSHRRKA